MVRNRDWENWTRVMQVGPLTEEEAAELAAADEGNKRAQPVTRVRPGHADLAGALKYGFNDVRNVLERSSARETAARVAAGGVARAFLRELGIEVWSFTAEVGGVAVDPARCTRSRDEADASPLRCPDPDAETAMIARIDEARSNGDTVGGVFEVVVHGAADRARLYVHWDRRLDAALAAAVMSINIVKGVEFGLGFEQTRRFGSAVHDVIEGRGDDGTLGPPVEQRRRPDRRRDERRAARRARRGQADLDPRAAAAVGRPRDRRAGREGALRAERHLRRARRGRHRRGDGDAHARRCDAREVRRRLDAPRCSTTCDRDRARIAAPIAAPAAGDGSGGRARRRPAGPSPRPDRPARPAPAATTEPRDGPRARRAARHRQERRRPPPGRPPRRDVRRPRRARSSARRADRSPSSSRSEGEAAFRALEREAVAALGPPDPAPALRRVIATGGGAVVDPRNRWALYRGRLPVWLDVRPEVLAQRLRRSPNVRPLIAGRRPDGPHPRPRRGPRAVLRGGRRGSTAWPSWPAWSRRVEALGRGGGVPTGHDAPAGRRRAIGDLVIGEGIAAAAVGDALARLGARRAILVSEPGAWAAVGDGLARRAARATAGRSSRCCCRRARRRSGSP